MTAHLSVVRSLLGQDYAVELHEGVMYHSADDQRVLAALAGQPDPDVLGVTVQLGPNSEVLFDPAVFVAPHVPPVYLPRELLAGQWTLRGRRVSLADQVTEQLSAYVQHGVDDLTVTLDCF